MAGPGECGSIRMQRLPSWIHGIAPQQDVEAQAKQITGRCVGGNDLPIGRVDDRALWQYIDKSLNTIDIQVSPRNKRSKPPVL